MNRRFTDDQEREIVAAVLAGEPVKAVALRQGAPYMTVLTILHRSGVSPKATDDPDRLRLRQRWAKNAQAMRQRRTPNGGTP